MKKRVFFSVLCLFVFLLNIVFVLSLQAESYPGKKGFKIYTSFYPVYFAASQIAGERAVIESVVPDGVEVHGFEPSPQKLSSLLSADIFFYIGLGLEPWAEKMSADLQAKGIEPVMLGENLTLLEAGSGYPLEEGKYTAEIDPHVWLDPLNMIEISLIIKEKLSIMNPENSKYYQSNFEEFTARLKELHRRYKDTLKIMKRDYILVSHAAFAYLGNRYGFYQLPVTGLSPEAEPSPGDIAKIIKKAREDELKYIFKETLASSRSVMVVAEEADLEVLTLNPIAGLTPEEQKRQEDYFTLMEKNLKNLKKGLVE